MVRALAGLGVVVLLLGACGQKAPDTPEAVYKAFFDALAAKDWDRAVGFFCTPVREELRREGERLVALAGAKEDPLDYLLSEKRSLATLVRPLRKVEVVSRDRDAVILQVTAGDCPEGKTCSVTKVKMAREAGRWVVAPETPALLTASTKSGDGR